MTCIRGVATGSIMLLTALPAAAGQFSVIYQFPGGAAGRDPAGPLVMDAQRNIYGIATGGGIGDGRGGLVFKLSESGPSQWQESVLHSFSPVLPNGPVGPGLAMGRDGVLYGSQLFNGQGGAVFRLAPSLVAGSGWRYDVIYTFPGRNAPQGAAPSGTLLIDAAGDVFGTTQGGGDEADSYPCFCGVAYELSPMPGSGSYSETVLHAFTIPPDAGLPDGGLTAGADGTLYGTTLQGGTGHCLDGSNVAVIGCGAVYSLNGAGGVGSEKVLYSFTQRQENGPFDNLRLGLDGALYGVAGLDVYRLLPPRTPGGRWHQQVIYEFPGGITGIAPAGAVVFDRTGRLYGTTLSFGLGGAPTLYRLSPPATSDAPWLETTLYTFRDGTGFVAQPYGALLRGRDGAVYGTVGSGNGQNGYVFAYRP